jgi:Concanavalin A-like lectin/glucanases superfamily/PEP-CTERM motif
MQSKERLVNSRIRFALAVFPLLVVGVTARAGTSPNTGSLGSAADGTDSATVTNGTGVVTGGGTDQSAVYTGVAGSNTTVPYQSAINPGVASPFSIEFWGNPSGSDNDDAPVSNRTSTGNRSGWVFFQRAAGTGWNFRMYNGVTSGLGWDLTGGTSTVGNYSHVVATWNGSSALLYVNGVLADNTNDPAATGVYNPTASGVPLTVGTIDGGGSPYAGAIDEVAFYSSALTPVQILNHFNLIASPIANSYFNQVRADGALLQLSNNPVPEPSSMLLLGAGGALLLRRRR